MNIYLELTDLGQSSFLEEESTVPISKYWPVEKQGFLKELCQRAQMQDKNAVISRGKSNLEIKWYTYTSRSL